MSTHEAWHRVATYARNTRRRKALLDLNVTPPTENREQENVASARTGPQNGPSVQQGGSTLPPPSPPPPPPPPPPPIDVEAFDDDVIISSPRAFAEARNNSRRTRGRALVVNVESEGSITITEGPVVNTGGPSSRAAPNRHSKRRRVSLNQTFINSDQYINVEESSNAVRALVPPPPPPPPEPTFSCPVCMGQLVEEMSTKCGHIFCKACIKTAITVQGKCPTCRRKINMKDIIRVYLPTTN